LSDPTVAARKAGTVRVIAGKNGVRGQPNVYPIELWDRYGWRPERGEFSSGRRTNHLLLVQRGGHGQRADNIAAGELVVLDPAGTGMALRLRSRRGAILAGEPLGEPVEGQGPFVMNTREQIFQAISDYQAGKMGHLA
jgi:redox-sensitive bicupin YhaK (pirin superfamily)